MKRILLFIALLYSCFSIGQVKTNVNSNKTGALLPQVDVYDFGARVTNSASANATAIAAAYTYAAANHKAVFFGALYTTTSITTPDGVTTIGIDSTTGFKFPSGTAANARLVVAGNQNTFKNIMFDGEHSNLLADIDTKLLSTDAKYRITVERCWFKNASLNAILVSNTNDVLVNYCVFDSIGGCAFAANQGNNVYFRYNQVRGWGFNDAAFTAVSVIGSDVGATNNTDVSHNQFYNRFNATNFMFESGGATAQIQTVRVTFNTFNGNNSAVGGVSLAADSILMEGNEFANCLPAYGVEIAGSNIDINHNNFQNLGMRIGTYLKDTAYNVRIKNNFWRLRPSSDYDAVVAFGGHPISGANLGVFRNWEFSENIIDGTWGNPLSMVVIGSYTVGGHTKMLNGSIERNLFISGNSAVGLEFAGNGGDITIVKNNRFYGIGNGVQVDTGIYKHTQFIDNIQPSGTFLHSSVDQTSMPNYWDINNQRDTSLTQRLTVATVSYSISSGTPEGSVTANKGSVCSDITNGVVYYKNTGTGNTGWVLFGSSGGGVSAISIASSNGFAGSSSGGSTPILTLSTSITGILKGNATAISAASAGTDYVVPAGNVATATALATARAIYGNNFDGTAALTQIIASTYGGTGNGFTKFSGPATSEKTFTLPNASSTILTDNAAVTVLQGGTGRSTGTTAYALIATGTTATGNQQTLANAATTEILVGGGASALPVWTTATGTGAPVRAGSPAMTGNPTAPTQSPANNSTRLATTEYTDIMGTLHYTLAASDANTTVTNAYDYFVVLPVATANRTLTLPTASSYTGRTIEVWNKNTSGTFSWTFASTVKDAAGTTITAIGNLNWYNVYSDGTNWVINQSSTYSTTVSAPQFAFAEQTLSDGATITWTVTSGSNAAVTLGGNRTLAISGAAAGSYGTLRVIQDGTGSRTLTLPGSSKVIGGGAGAVTLTTTAGAVDILTYYYTGSAYYWTIGKNYN